MDTKKIKKTLAAALSLVITSTSMSATLSSYAEDADTYNDYDDYYDYEDEEFDGAEGTYQNVEWIIDSNGVLTISGEGDMPSLYDEETGELLDESEDDEDNEDENDSEISWVDYSEYVTQVIIDDGLTSISDYAFAGFMSVSKVTIASTVKTIGDGAFYLDLELKKVVFNEGLEEIGLASFALTGLTSVKIPKSVNWVHTYAFAWNDDLTEYTILDNGAYFGAYSIGYTTDIYGNDIINSEVVINGYENSSIYTYALENGITFENLGTAKAENYIPEKYKLKTSGNCGEDITWNLVDGVLTLTGEGDMPEFSLANEELPEWYGETSKAITSIVIGDGITSVSESAFENCTNVTELSLGKDITEIADYAFKGTQITSLYLPENLEYIGAGAFSTTTLEEVVANPSIEYIAYYAISGSEDLTFSVYYGSLAEIYAEEKGFNIISLDEDDSDKKATSEILAAGYNNENWGFENTETDFPMALETGGYYISDNDLMQLVLKLSNIEYYYYGVQNLQYTNWGGSCYGMAVLVALIHNGEVDLASFGQDVSSVSELVNTNELESIINYYFVLQATDGKMQEMLNSYAKDKSVKIPEIVSTVEENSAKGEYSVIGIWGEDWGHEIVATGVEDGIWTFGSQSYNKCILIADPNFSEFNMLSCIYCNTDDGNWTIPIYFLPDETREIDLSENKTLNELGLFGNNTERQALTGSYFDTVTLLAESEDSYANYVSDGKATLLTEDTADFSEESYEDDFFGMSYVTKAYYLVNKNNYSYEFISDGSSLLSGSVLFNGIEADATTSCNGKKISVAYDKVSINFGDFSNVDLSEYFYIEDDDEDFIPTNTYDISFIVNDEYTTIPFASIDFYGTSDGDVSVERKEDGYIITSDALTSTTISASSLVRDTENVLFYENEYFYDVAYADVSEDIESVFVTYDEVNDCIVLYADLDNNGTYETEIDYDDIYDDTLIIEDEDGNSYYLYDDDEDGVIDRVVNKTEVSQPSITDEYKMEVRSENGKLAIYADLDGDGKCEEFIGYADNKTLSNGTADKDTTSSSKSLGDINGDENVDSIDAVLILKDYAEAILGGKSSLDKSVADCNSDGTVDSIDAVLILKYYAKYILDNKVGSFANFVK